MRNSTTKMRKIPRKTARAKYGIVTSGASNLYAYYLLDNGNVIDSDGDVRYIAPKAKR